MGRKSRSLPQRTYKLTITRIIAAEVKVVLHMQPDDIHVLLFNRYRLMPKIHRWNYIISIDTFDTCIPSARCCSLCCSSRCIKWEVPACSTSQGCLWTEKWMGVNICQSDPSQHLSAEKCIIIFELCCLWSIISIIQLLTSDVFFSGQNNHYRFIQEELWQMPQFVTVTVCWI